MRGVEVIEDPAVAAVALDPIRAQLLAELAESPASRKPIVAAAPKSPSADAFRRLAGEVLQRLAAVRH